MVKFKSQVSLFVASAVLGDVGASLLVAGADLVKFGMIAERDICEMYFSIQNARGAREK